MNRTISFALSLLVPTAALAGDVIDPLVTLNVHFTESSYLGCGLVDDGAIAVCENLASTSSAEEVFAWIFVAKDGGLVLGDTPGIGAAAFGIEYEATVEISGWALCTGGAEIPQADFGGRWPDSGTGNAVTWAGGCYIAPAEVAKIGFLTAASGSTGLLMTRPDSKITSDGIAVFSCSPESELFLLCEAAMGFGTVGTGSTPVCGNPCDPTPSAEVTWSRMKSLF